LRRLSRHFYRERKGAPALLAANGAKAKEIWV
jgi:hypothetical protein